MSESGRPRRSAAAQNKVWAPLMSNKSGGEDDIFEDAPEPTRKRGASKETSGKSPGEDMAGAPRSRTKKVKLSDSVNDDSTGQDEQLAEGELNASITSPRSISRSPKKATPQAKKAPVAIVTSDAADLQRMQEEFDRHNTTAPLDEELEEEELVPAPVVTKPPPKPRGRQTNRPNVPPTLTGMDDPKDEDYSEEQEKKRPSPPKPKTAGSMGGAPRALVMKAPNVPRPVYRAPVTNIPRVIYPNRLPTVINGGPRVVQPRYNRPPSNSDLMTKPLPVHNYETPASVLADIDRLSKNLKDNGDPTINGVFELVQIMREEMERSQKALSEATQFYQDYIERFQILFSTNDEEYQKRVRNLEQRISHLEGQLKKASAIAHQKLLKGREEGPHTQKLIPQQYVVVGETGAMEQSHPTNYLVQEEEYTAVGPQGTYYHHEAVIQEASKEVDNML